VAAPVLITGAHDTPLDRNALALTWQQASGRCGTERRRQ
jgi:hypothetical protein